MSRNNRRPESALAGYGRWKMCLRFQAGERCLGSHQNHMCYQQGSCAGTGSTFLRLGISSCDVLAESPEQRGKASSFVLGDVAPTFLEKARLRVRVRSLRRSGSESVFIHLLSIWETALKWTQIREMFFLLVLTLQIHCHNSSI